MKKILRLFLVFSILSTIAFHKRIYFNYLSKQKLFETTLAESNKTILDLTNFGKFKWDEITFWGPYQNICNLGISGYESGFFTCASSYDDSECYLLFLKNNELVGQVKIDRKKIDFATSNINWRIQRKNAKFRFLSKEDWPKVGLTDN